MRIEEIDKNFEGKLSDDGKTVFYDASQPPFTVHGLLRDEDGYYRLPYSLAAQTNEGVEALNLHTAGGRVRFMTDAGRIVIRAQMRSVIKMSHMTVTGSSGFDLYSGGVFKGAFIPPFDFEDGYTCEIETGGSEMREITIHFPLYCGVTRLEIGIPPGSRLMKAPGYAVSLPVVFYGSSITQGGCASRPGNAYDNILSMRLSCEHINLGFSGSAKGERCMAEYIAGLEMSAFIMDYDHNAPDPAHLEATHGPFFEIIREKNPSLPVIMLSRPQPNPDSEDFIRRDIIKKTFDSAQGNGDRNVYFIDGIEMMNIPGGDSATVDKYHPNDLGFYLMAKAVEPVLRKALFKN